MHPLYTLEFRKSKNALFFTNRHQEYQSCAEVDRHVAFAKVSRCRKPYMSIALFFSTHPAIDLHWQSIEGVVRYRKRTELSSKGRLYF